ncbi:MAG: radical SAM/SPASM domain-containing protein [Vulcanimicrobiota bacterium]
MLQLRAPSVLYLQTADTCNYRCLDCSGHSHSEPRKSLSLNDWNLILDRVLPYIYEVRIMGGEPTLFHEFFPLIDSIQARNTIFSIFSNGCWPVPEAVIKGLRYYSCLNQFVITIFGHNASIHEWYSQKPGSFEEMKENVLQASIRGLKISLNCVIHRKNLHQYRSIYQFAMSLGAQSLILSRYHCISPCEHRDEELAIGKDEWSALLKEVDNHSHKRMPVRFDHCFPQCLSPQPSNGCYSGTSIAAIDSRGNLHPCPRAPHIFGNISDTSLEKIWSSNAAFLWRKKALPDPCMRCLSVNQCLGGCKNMGKGDPLIHGPLEDDTGRNDPLQKLDGLLSPVGNFLVRKEGFGFALVRGHVVIPVSSRFSGIIDALDGTHSLNEISSSSGEDVLSFLYNLYKRDFIFFV